MKIKAPKVIIEPISEDKYHKINFNLGNISEENSLKLRIIQN